ncbi:hypothetical protein SynROS8604_00434 [Synechococcus sp. ROS8604]|nr:hypothetical protein SynROS8604_00434 [Synechococcus sp. ROS8604]
MTIQSKQSQDLLKHQNHTFTSDEYSVPKAEQKTPEYKQSLHHLKLDREQYCEIDS